MQYQAPWYRALAGRLDLDVLFAHRITPADHARSGFGIGFEWDVPLLDGYSSAWLSNVARRPGVDRFWGCNAPDVGPRLAGGRYDAVLVNGWNLAVYWQAVRAARRLGLPILVRGDSQLTTARAWPRRAAKRVIYPRLLAWFDICLAVGRRSEDYYRHYGVPAARLHRSPHCVDNAFFARAVETASAPAGGARRVLGVPEPAVVFLFAGKLTDMKRPLDFLRALDRIHRTDSNVWGLIVGDGPLRTVMEAHRARHGTPCALAGFLNQGAIGAAYAAADALVLPSDGRETWGLVVNEAMAGGVPAIVSDQAGCAPDLIVEGETGYTYPCGDVAALADRMEHLAAKPVLRRAMRARCRAHIQSFAPEVAAGGVVDALDALLDKARAGELVKG